MTVALIGGVFPEMAPPSQRHEFFDYRRVAL